MSIFRGKAVVASILAVVIALQGCAGPVGDAVRGAGVPLPTSSTSSGTGGGSGTDYTKVLVEAGGATVGAGIGVGLAIALARADQKRLKLSEKDFEKRKKGYMITFGLAGLAVGGIVAGTVYGKLKEAGKKEREQALIAAATNARPARYGEPTDPTLKGTVVPGKRYTELSANRECVDTEDTLADATSKDSTFAKLCRALPNGTYEVVTA